MVSALTVALAYFAADARFRSTSGFMPLTLVIVSLLLKPQDGRLQRLTSTSHTEQPRRGDRKGLHPSPGQDSPTFFTTPCFLF